MAVVGVTRSGFRPRSEVQTQRDKMETHLWYDVAS